jgi:hypothetical protein
MLIRYAIIILCLCSTRLSASEPLRGPELGWTSWRNISEVTPATGANVSQRIERLERERRLVVDAPIPVALWMTMPFVTVRYEDQMAADIFRADQRFGFGLLHHAAEGEPAWRIDLSRIGTWNHKPAIHARTLFNLVKAAPALRLRPSDTTYSWVGINVLKLPASGKTLFIPELAWSRLGTDGLAIDIMIPQHIYLGYSGRVFGVMTGVQQFYRLWQLTDGGGDDDGTFESRAKISLLYTLSTESSGSYLLTSSLLQDMESKLINASNKATSIKRQRRGAEISIQWIPNA